VATPGYCDSGQVATITDYLEVRLRFQLFRFALENYGVIKCNGWTNATPPNDVFLYRMAAKGINKYLAELRTYTKRVYAPTVAPTTSTP
jgi:hypothetical protein